MAEKLAELHLADLYELAAELEVPRFRLLRREQLVAEVKARLGTSSPAGVRREREPKPEAESQPEAEPERQPEPETKAGS